MLGNGPDPTCTTRPNGVGDCTFAGRQHYRMAKAAAAGETETWETTNALVTEYLTYDHGQDNGANIADLLLSWYKAGRSWPSPRSTTPTRPRWTPPWPRSTASTSA